MWDGGSLLFVLPHARTWRFSRQSRASLLQSAVARLTTESGGGHTGWGLRMFGSTSRSACAPRHCRECSTAHNAALDLGSPRRRSFPGGDKRVQESTVMLNGSDMEITEKASNKLTHIAGAGIEPLFAPLVSTKCRGTGPPTRLIVSLMRAGVWILTPESRSRQESWVSLTVVRTADASRKRRMTWRPRERQLKAQTYHGTGWPLGQSRPGSSLNVKLHSFG